MLKPLLCLTKQLYLRFSKVLIISKAVAKKVKKGKRPARIVKTHPPIRLMPRLMKVEILLLHRLKIDKVRQVICWPNFQDSNWKIVRVLSRRL